MPIDRGRFGAVLGTAFQDYVGLILKGLPGVPSIYPETRYTDKGTEQVTCDWIAVDQDTAVMIECKRSAVNALAKVTADRSHIKRDLGIQHGVVDGVMKLFDTEHAIRQGCPGLEFLQGIRRFYGLLVVLDDFYLPNSPYVRQLVHEALQDRGAELEDRIQFAHIGGLEWLVNLLGHQGTSIAALIEAKIAAHTYVEMDFKNFAPDYATRNLPGVEITPWMPQFNTAYDEFIEQMLPKLRAS